MRKALLVLALGTLLAFAGTAAAKAPPVICGGAPCDGGGGGWTGCTLQTESDSGGIPFVARYRHYLVVSYCKRYGIITSLSIEGHGCDTSGFVICSPGPAWLTGGGVGYGYATFTAKATWYGAADGVPYASTSTVNLTVNWG